jgi:hypothetical protein
VRSGFVFLSQNATTTTGTHIVVGKSFFTGANETCRQYFYYARSFCVIHERQWAVESIRHVYWQMFENFTADPDEIYLHVRASDVMTNGTGFVHGGYGQPPCHYYTEAAIMHGNMSKMVVVTDGGLNPCIPFLESLGARILLCSPFETIGRLSHARRFALAKSTFSQAAMSLSQHLRDGKFYSFGVTRSLPAPHWHCIPTPVYQEKVLNLWRSSVDQLALMQNSSCERWVLIWK